MLDAVGKPSAGIKRGVLYFVGNYDQCKSTVSKIPANTSLGEFQSADDVTFKGRYCRSTFHLPQGLINSVAGKHANVSLSILCFVCIFQEILQGVGKRCLIFIKLNLKHLI